MAVARLPSIVTFRSLGSRFGSLTLAGGGGVVAGGWVRDQRAQATAHTTASQVVVPGVYSGTAQWEIAGAAQREQIADRAVAGETQ
ncbi:hypothetical protein CGZ96_19990 [Enemella evansiae]|nr:hypothetical protein CGZ96_19990 [Enemella evansiae]